MTQQFKKTIVVSLVIFGVIAAVILVFFQVKKQTEVLPSPTPRPTQSVDASPATPGVFEVGSQDACVTTFTVTTQTSASPSPSLSPSPSPSLSPSPSPSAPPGAELDCVVKRAYKDETTNTAGNYSLSREIVDTNTVLVGDRIVFNIVAGNHGGLAASDVVTVTDTLGTAVEFVDSESSCSYTASNRKVSCTLGAIAGGAEKAVSFRVSVVSAGSKAVANTATVSSTNGQTDSCTIAISSTGIVQSPTPNPSPSSPPEELPTAGIMSFTTGTIGAGILLLLLGALGLLML